MAAYVGLGSNLGDRAGSIRHALYEMSKLPEITVVQVSSFYETDPVGVIEQPEFLNAAAGIQTTLTPTKLLQVLLEIEKRMGRVRTLRWGPRVIDLDLLLYGEERIALPDLCVPHPRLTERAFVLVPLAEIAGHVVTPGQERTVAQLAKIISGSGNIRRLTIV